MATKKYVSLSKLSTFLDNLKGLFATKTSVEDIVDGTTKVGKATSDGNGDVISTTYETKTDASGKLTEAKTYTDNAVTQKSQVQIITWEDDD